MPERMHIAELQMTDSESGQMVAVLDEPYRILVRRAEVPEPGDDEVRVKINGIGWGRVVGYQVIDGFLGIWVDAREKPRWYLEQNGNVPGLSFGAELEMGPS